MALVGLAGLIAQPATLAPSGLARVIDGDTLELAGERVRLLGLDAPERGQLCRRDGREWPCGEAARAALADFVQPRALVCEGSERDRWGRLLAQCRAGSEDGGAWLVSEGWAVSYGRGGRGAYRALEAQARLAGVGIWAGEFEPPADWRRRRRESLRS